MDEVGLLVADVYECAGLLRRIGQANAAKVGQTQARWQLLSVISDSSFTVAQAARRMGITRQSVQRIANELVTDMLAEFQRNPDHANSPLLSLTPKGRQVLKKITDNAQGYHSELVKQLGDTEFSKVHANIKALSEVLQEIVDNKEF